MTRSTRSLALLLILLAACGDSFTAPDVHSLRAVQLDVPPVAVVASAIRFRVVVLDANDKPVAGQAVNFVVTAGGGHVYGGVETTNASGIAAEEWTLGTVAGQQVLEARATDADGAPLLLGKITATAIADAPVSIGGTDVVLWPSEHRSLGEALAARDKYGNLSALNTNDAKLAAGAFVVLGDTVIAPDTIGVVSSVAVTVVGASRSIRLFTAPNMAKRSMVYRSACPAAGFDSVTQVTVQDPVVLAADRLSFTFTGRTTSVTYWSGGKVASNSGPTHSYTTGAVAMTIRPDTLKSSLETFIRKGDAARYGQTQFLAGSQSCGKSPFGASYSAE